MVRGRCDGRRSLSLILFGEHVDVGPLCSSVPSFRIAFVLVTWRLLSRGRECDRWWIRCKITFITHMSHNAECRYARCWHRPHSSELARVATPSSSASGDTGESTDGDEARTAAPLLESAKAESSRLELGAHAEPRLRGASKNWHTVALRI